MKGTEIKVLDHGYVKLIDYMGSDEAVVEAARMSTGRGFISWESYLRCKRCDETFASDLVHCPGCGANDSQEFPRGDGALLEHLYANKHLTPFECGGEMIVEVQAPIMVFREWHRHRTQSFNEFSARYAQMPNLHYVPDASRIQKQSTTNKQGSSTYMGDSYAEQVTAEIREQQEDVYATYEGWVDDGLAKEVARINTPVSRYSKMRAKTDLRNWLAFLLLRKSSAAQWEIRQYADAVGQFVKVLWPRTYALFEEHDLRGAHLSRSELALLRKVMKVGEFVGQGYDLTDAESEVLRKLEKKMGVS